MSYAVAYIPSAKKHVVLHENWIFGVVESKLRNYGVNTNQNHLIFWSNCDNVTPDSSHIPNFTLTVQEEFLPSTDACYIGRIKRFFGT